MNKFVNTKPIRLVELFAGIGSQAKALKNLHIPFESHFVCDIDKYAVTSYNAVHGTDYKPCDIMDITAADLNIVDTDKYTYLLTYSFPCQDLSNAGKGAGMAEGSGTRSSLLWEVKRLLAECSELPQLLLMENVPQVHSKKYVGAFNEWIDFLTSLGYSNFWQDLNAKHFGMPQNRNRCIMVSILGDYSFTFPKQIPLKIHLSDLLETDVDEKFYLSQDYIEYARKLTAESEENGNGFKFKPFERERERERANSESYYEPSRAESNRQFHSGTYPVNPHDDGTCRTIKAQYANTSYANFLRTSTFGATGVLKVKGVIEIE